MTRGGHPTRSLIDMTGRVVSHWRVINKAPVVTGCKFGASWICECTRCKTRDELRGTDLRRGKPPSCPGCGAGRQRKIGELRRSRRGGEQPARREPVIPRATDDAATVPGRCTRCQSRGGFVGGRCVQCGARIDEALDGRAA